MVKIFSLKTIGIFWEIACLKASPETLKGSRNIFLASLSANFFVSLLINLNFEKISLAAALSLLECLTLIVLTATILLYSKKYERLNKTISALMGIGAIIGIFAYLLIVVLPPSLLIIFRPAILIWNLSATAKVLTHSMEIGFGRAFLIAIGYAFCLWQILTFFYSMIAV